MPKRKQTKDYEEDLIYLAHKIKRLERKIRKNKEKSASSSPDVLHQEKTSKPASPTNEITENDWLEDPEAAEIIPAPEAVQDALIQETESEQATSLHATETVQDSTTPTNERENMELDKEIIEILGEDPSASTKYGPEIREELACRLQHIATQGVSKETRKLLTDKYLIPSNCLHIDAPKINPEMKAAIPEAISKRDKGIEAKQKQLACAISCITESLNILINAKDKDNTLIQKLMDAARILCDIQHGDSITRRNFIMFSLKKDERKEHLSLTKIDSMLFSSNLYETLKSAKAVNKSGTELKPDYSTNKQAVSNPKKDKYTSFKPLNRKAAPAAARRPTGPAFREYAAPRAQHPPTQHARSSKTSSHRPPPGPAHRRTH